MRCGPHHPKGMIEDGVKRVVLSAGVPERVVAGTSRSRRHVLRPTRNGRHLGLVDRFEDHPMDRTGSRTHKNGEAEVGFVAPQRHVGWGHPIQSPGQVKPTAAASKHISVDVDPTFYHAVLVHLGLHRHFSEAYPAGRGSSVRFHTKTPIGRHRACQLHPHTRTRTAAGGPRRVQERGVAVGSWCDGPVPTIAAGCTQASKSAALTPPLDSAASRSVVPCFCACLAMRAARS